MTIDTVGSTPGEVLMVPTPRMNSELSLFDALVRKFTVGTTAVMVAMLLRLASSSPPPVSTDTAIGVLCRGCSRLVAVMVMVSTLPLSGGGACCASAGKAAQRARASGSRRLRGCAGERLGMGLSPCPRGLAMPVASWC